MFERFEGWAQCLKQWKWRVKGFNSSSNNILLPGETYVLDWVYYVRLGVRRC
jgi:hypothetical protein